MASLGSLTNNFFSTAHETFTDTTSGTISGGDTTVAITNLSEYSDGDVVTITIAPGDATKQRTFTGVKSGSNVTNVVWTEDPFSYGTGTYSAGSTVKDLMSATHHAAMTKGILQEHTAAGAHGNITGISITTSGNATVGGTLTQTGNATFSGTVTVNNKTVKKYDESSNSVDVDPMSRNEGFQGLNFVQTGLVSTTSSGLTAAISSGTYYIGGKRYTYAGGTKLLTASKDSYLDIDTSGIITEVTATIGAASPALTANSIRIAKVLTGAGSITSHNTGTVLDTAFDSIGNRIRRLSPFDRIIGMGIKAGAATATTEGDILLTVPPTAIVPTGVPIKVTLTARYIGLTNSEDQSVTVRMYQGAAVAGTLIDTRDVTPSGAAIRNRVPLNISRTYIPAAGGTLTFNSSLQGSGAGATIFGDATTPIRMMVELA